MAYEVQEYPGTVNGERFTSILIFNANNNPLPYINGINVVAAKFDNDGKWYVIANVSSDDPKYPKHGPFDTDVEAAVFIQLAKD